MRRNGKYIKCAICNKNVYIPKHRFNTARYCSRKCLTIFKTGNPNIGRRKGTKMPKEFCEKMSKALKGRKFTKEWRYKLGNSGRGKFGEKNSNWKGGEVEDTHGYILIKKRNHPFANNKGYILRSHLVMEKKIGRYLKPKEIVHHINEIRNDDRPENLMLFPNVSKHIKFHRDNPKPL